MDEALIASIKNLINYHQQQTMKFTSFIFNTRLDAKTSAFEVFEIFYGVVFFFRTLKH